MRQPEWNLEDHVCRFCLGRVLSKPAPNGGRVYRCSNCGITHEGHRPDVICACGLTLRTGKRAGVKCSKAEAPSPDFPAEIVVVAVEK